MKKTDVQKLAKVVQILITVTFVCNLIALPLVPGFAGIQAEGAWKELSAPVPGENPLMLPLRLAGFFFASCWQYLWRVWRMPYAVVLTVFLWACGTCTAIILWQAWRVLDTVIGGNPFQKRNAVDMYRAAACFFVISGAALVRLVIQLIWFHRATAYNALFVPVFALGGLLCLVMSALFRQAAELKEENDLTI